MLKMVRQFFRLIVETHFSVLRSGHFVRRSVLNIFYMTMLNKWNKPIHLNIRQLSVKLVVRIYICFFWVFENEMM